MEFGAFITSIEEKITNTLPGTTSQLKMASMRRLMQEGKVVVPENVKKAGVLALFYPYDGSIYLVLIKRNEYPGVHSGQISFPGGGWEDCDKDLIDTALRETEEEIGVNRNAVIPIGKLTDLFIPPSNFLVTPIVGYSHVRPDFKPDPAEVERILEIPLDSLLDLKTRQEQEITIYPAVKLKVPCFYVDEYVIWGATAMMISELIDLINQES
jgi:8-oxo-dGTP pyrophosphatase MutT (NUDIX family)